MNSRSLLSSHATTAAPALPVLEKGFRPFFLAGAAFAIVAVPLWIVALKGGIAPGGAFGPLQWHAHEMLFGFSTAIIAGFLLTAISNWCGRETVTGLPLGSLVALWTVGRVAVFFASSLPRFVPILLDVSFLPALTLACATPLLAAGNRRNYGFIGLLLGLAIANGVAHVFALRGDFATVWLAHLLALSELSPKAGTLSLVLSAVAAALLLARMRFWGTRHVFRQPLLWILHLGTLFVPLGLALRVLAAFVPVIPMSSSLHALTAGAIGSLTLGMMARVSLGHTGRLIEPARTTRWSLMALVCAAVIRVGAPFLPSAWYLNGLSVASLLWSGAFTLFLLSYWKILCSPRVDAR